MPTAQSTSTSNQNKNVKQVDNKIAKAVAKVEQSKPTTNATQEQAAQSGAASTTGNKTPQDQPEFIKQSLIIIEKKVRNLEKRRIKLDEYKESQRKGTVLNEDQLAAVSKYEEVVRSLELARELEKQFVTIANDAMKQQKKQAKKDQLEREEAVKEKLREAHKVTSLLNTFGDENVRNDFLNEVNGATKLSQQELTLLDEFNKLVQSTELGNKLESASAEAAEHLLNLIEGKNKPITSFNQEVTGAVTYNDLKKLFDRILTSAYWTYEPQQVVSNEPEATEETNQTEQQQTTEQAQSQEALSEQMNNLDLNQNQNDQSKSENHMEQQQQQQAVYQQNTSDDYVLVNSNDFSDNTRQSPNMQQQAPQTKAFFTTLNPTSNINEFLQNNGEGINFLQDSEIQSRQQQEQPQQTQQQQAVDNFHSAPQQQTQEFTQNEGQRDNRGGNRGGHRDYNGNRNYEQRRNYDQRRSGPRDGNYQPRDNNYQPRDNNAPRNGGSGGYRGRGGYRGGYSNSGPRTGTGGQQYQQRAPRDSNHQQQPVPKN